VTIPDELMGEIINQMSTNTNPDYGSIALDGYLIGFYSQTGTNDIFLTEDFWEHNNIYYEYTNPTAARKRIKELEKILFSNNRAIDAHD